MSEKAKASGSQPNGSADARSRTHHDGSSTRAFTVEQKAAVIRVKRCKATDFYDILGLEAVKTSCSDSDIKKAYRKLSLLTHPDKNGYEGADEAFKMVSRAFQVLSDPDKKSKYDKFGGDPESRFGPGGGGGAASPFSGFASQRHAGRGPVFEEEISPEELFRQFFGGGGMGGGFGGPFGGFGGPGFVFNMGGGPGIRIHQFGGGAPRRRPHNHENAEEQRSPLGMLQSLLPMILLFLLPLLSSLFTGSGSSGPTIRMDGPIPPHTQQRISARLKVPYWVNPTEVQDYSGRKWKDLDRSAEGRFVNTLSLQCESEQNQKQRLINDAQGFFFTDQEKLDKARKFPMANCQKLHDYGYRLPSY